MASRGPGSYAQIEWQTVGFPTRCTRALALVAGVYPLDSSFRPCTLVAAALALPNDRAI